MMASARRERRHTWRLRDNALDKARLGIASSAMAFRPAVPYLIADKE
jgi:hypothetical protein